VMPYSSSTGCSGVAHLACAYGVPIVSADIADFRQMALGEELAIEFYPPGSAKGLADCLVNLLQESEKQQRMATQNFSAALRMTMPNVVQKYLRHFELQQRVQTLRYVSRFRRLPRWIPSKSLLLRLMTRNSLGWARRSALLHSNWNGNDAPLLHGDGNGGGKLNGSGSSINGHRVGLERWNGGGTDGIAGANSGARSSYKEQGNHRERSNGHHDASTLSASDYHEPEKSEAQPAATEKELPSFAALRTSSTDRLNGQNGSSPARPGSDGRGRE
jgi:hypothetical protein